MPNKIEIHTVESLFAGVTAALILVVLLPSYLTASASINSSQLDMKSVTNSLNESLTKLTGVNSSNLLKSTLSSINNTASQLANESKGIINESSLGTAESIAKKIGIGIADVLSNISGEVKQGIESK